MANAHIKGMTKFALVLRGPKRTAVVAARFQPSPPSLLWSPRSLWLPTPSTLPEVFTVAVLLAVLNIIPCHCYRLLHPPCRSGKEVVFKVPMKQNFLFPKSN